VGKPHTPAFAMKIFSSGGAGYVTL
jgi:hypothetical protein